MKLKLALLPALAMLCACAQLGLVTPQSFQERLAAGYVATTTVRSTATALLEASKISPGDAQNVQEGANSARAGLDIARDMQASEPAAADARLTAAITALSALAKYLEDRK